MPSLKHMQDGHHYRPGYNPEFLARVRAKQARDLREQERQDRLDKIRDAAIDREAAKLLAEGIAFAAQLCRQEQVLAPKPIRLLPPTTYSRIEDRAQGGAR